MKLYNKGFIEVYFFVITLIFAVLTYGIIKSANKFEAIEINAETIQSNQEAIKKINDRITAIEKDVRTSRQLEK